MKKISAWWIPVFGLALSLITDPAAAGGGLLYDAQIRQFCALGEGSDHPDELILMHEVSGAPFEASRLILGYETDATEFRSRGIVRATVIRHRGRGRKKNLGVLRAWQNKVSGDALNELLSAAPIRAGDVLEWKFRFNNFDPLPEGQCFLLLAILTDPARNECGPYPDWQTSEYILPYGPGPAHVISQGNCFIGSHRDEARYAYDFAMPVGTDVLAVRRGTVYSFSTDNVDGLGGPDNWLRIEHDDGTFATYTHIQQNGALVEVGQVVEQGDRIALSGNSGGTGGLPHLHLQVTPCVDRTVCGTLPITFRNTSPNPNGLVTGLPYTAMTEP